MWIFKHFAAEIVMFDNRVLPQTQYVRRITFPKSEKIWIPKYLWPRLMHMNYSPADLCI
jgi:hypothetical protein